MITSLNQGEVTRVIDKNTYSTAILGEKGLERGTARIPTQKGTKKIHPNQKLEKSSKNQT